MSELLKTYKIKMLVHETKGQQVSSDFIIALESHVRRIVIKSSNDCRFKRIMAEDLKTKVI